jgi:cytochrome c oxidase assembly protein subunit 15
MSESDLPKRFLHWYAGFVAASVLVLICSGGLVTSHGAGMAVPDWPNSFGYNMFLFPVSHWIGGVFFEHTHRLIASGVGLLTVALCVLTLMVEDRVWVKWLAGIGVLAVIIQGVLGGLRVTEHNAVLGLFHGCLAQGFFCLVATLALVTSRFWHRIGPAANQHQVRSLRFWTVTVTAMLFVQLALGASMRHSHTGLSIPDFPTVYGGLFPPLDGASIARINEARATTQAAPPITSGLILLQYIHRVWAVFIVAGLISVATGILRNRQIPGPARSAAGVWLALIIVQFVLGAWTIWSNKAADIATSHVFVGALTLMTGVLLSVVLSAMLSSTPREDTPATLRKEAARA